ncbi:hypothetical protein C5167_003724, partial [Papaver somniferum]
MLVWIESPSASNACGFCFSTNDQIQETGWHDWFSEYGPYGPHVKNYTFTVNSFKQLSKLVVSHFLTKVELFNDYQEEASLTQQKVHHYNIIVVGQTFTVDGGDVRYAIANYPSNGKFLESIKNYELPENFREVDCIFAYIWVATVLNCRKSESLLTQNLNICMLIGTIISSFTTFHIFTLPRLFVSFRSQDAGEGFQKGHVGGFSSAYVSVICVS